MVEAWEAVTVVIRTIKPGAGRGVRRGRALRLLGFPLRCEHRGECSGVRAESMRPLRSCFPTQKEPQRKGYERERRLVIL
jgi:hypothetical protein